MCACVCTVPECVRERGGALLAHLLRQLPGGAQHEGAGALQASDDAAGSKLLCPQSLARAGVRGEKGGVGRGGRRRGRKGGRDQGEGEGETQDTCHINMRGAP